METTICDARYSKNCGGISEKGNNVWDINFQPYLDSIIDSENTDTIDLSKEEHFKEWLLNKQNSFCGPEYINEAYLGQYLGNVDEKGEYYRWEISYTNSELVKIIMKIRETIFKNYYDSSDRTRSFWQNLNNEDYG